jgi:DnaJ-class molecular chaperone
MTTTNYYKVLGVEKEASAKEVKDAYRHLAFVHHPDRNRDNPDAAEKMKAINEAYAVLSDRAKRSAYDAMRRQYGTAAHEQFRSSYSEEDIFRGSDVHAIFEEMARAAGFRGFDEIFRQFYGPGYRTFEFRQPGFFAGGFIFGTPMGRGRRRGRKGIGGRGGFGRLGRQFLQTLAGIREPVRGADLHDTIRLHPDLARTGGPYAYLLRKHAKKLVVKVPAGVKDGQRIRLSGMGEKGKAGGEAGDLYLKVELKRPLLEKARRAIGSLLGR